MFLCVLGGYSSRAPSPFRRGCPCVVPLLFLIQRLLLPSRWCNGGDSQRRRGGTRRKLIAMHSVMLLLASRSLSTFGCRQKYRPRVHSPGGDSPAGTVLHGCPLAHGPSPRHREDFDAFIVVARLTNALGDYRIGWLPDEEGGPRRPRENRGLAGGETVVAKRRVAQRGWPSQWCFSWLRRVA